MKRIASLITAVIIMLNVSLAYMSTIKADGYGIKVTSEEGSEIQIIPTSNKIKSWQVESGNTTVTNNKFTMPGEDTTIIAVTLATNTLTIQMPDFTRIENRTEEESITIEAVEIEGKEFTSWTATGITLTEGQSTSTTITITMPGNAVTLVANYQNKTYTITYDANGGSGAPASQTKTHGEAIAISETTPTREGYTFKGWATSNTATTAEYEAGSEYITNANLSLYAVWEEEVTAIIANENVALGAYITYVPSNTTSTVLGTDSGAIVYDMIYYGYDSDKYETSNEEASGSHIGTQSSGYVTESSKRMLVNQIYNPSNTTSWRVLNNSNGQLEIISTESIGNLTLRGTLGYTKAVYTLNKLCQDYINPMYADNARNPGYVKGNRIKETIDTERVSNSSLPVIDTNTYLLTYTAIKNYTNEDVSESDTKFPYIDTLYGTEEAQISEAEVIHNDGYVWLASRDMYVSSLLGDDTLSFEVRYFDSNYGVNSDKSLCSSYTDASNNLRCNLYGYSYGVRPIVSLKTGIKITGGEGTLASPYTISID